MRIRIIISDIIRLFEYICTHASPWETKITVVLVCISIGITLDKMRLANNEKQGRGEIAHNALLTVNAYFNAMNVNGESITRCVFRRTVESLFLQTTNSSPRQHEARLPEYLSIARQYILREFTSRIELPHRISSHSRAIRTVLYNDRLS